MEKRKKRLQRRASRHYERMVKNRCEKSRGLFNLENQIRSVNKKIRGRHTNHIHQMTSKLVKAKPAFIVIEDLSVSGMLKNHRIAKAIQDNRLAKVRRQLEYKCEWYGVGLIITDRFYSSSKLCSDCGHKKSDLKLSDRTYHCFECGTTMNSSYGKIGRAKLGREQKLSRFYKSLTTGITVRFIRLLVKFLILMFVVFCMSWFGLKYYFTHINRISNKVRIDVFTQIQTHHSQFLTYNEIPETYRSAVIATEDRSFFTNIGINFRGMGRAIFVDVGGDGSLQGGSTITQQLVHNTLLIGIAKSLEWKVLESIYAVGLYDTMSKQETFALYANDIYFGQGAYGLYDAAKTYFGMAPSELNGGELTMLAGIPNAPSDYNPFRDIKFARERQHIVIQSMITDGIITELQAKQMISDPIRLRQ